MKVKTTFLPKRQLELKKKKNEKGSQIERGNIQGVKLKNSGETYKGRGGFKRKKAQSFCGGGKLQYNIRSPRPGERCIKHKG